MVFRRGRGRLAVLVMLVEHSEMVIEGRKDGEKGRGRIGQIRCVSVLYLYLIELVFVRIGGRV